MMRGTAPPRRRRRRSVWTRRSSGSSSSDCAVGVEARRRRTASAAARAARDRRRASGRSGASVIWNGCGRPSGRSAMTSPSRISSRAGNVADERDDLGHGGGDVARVPARTPAPRRPALWTWTRAPSSLYSSVASPSSTERVADVLGRLREHRLDRPHELDGERVERGIAAGERRAARPVRDRRRASRRGGPAPPARRAARATASTSTPSSAPCRSSPKSRRRRKSCSSRVARAKRPRSARARVAADPLPPIAPIARKASSTVAELERRLRRGRHVRRPDDSRRSRRRCGPAASRPTETRRRSRRRPARRVTGDRPDGRSCPGGR